MGVIEPFVEEDWRRLKAIRLRALTEDPDAFGSTLSRELAFTEAAWRERLRRPRSVHLVGRVAAEDAGLAMACENPYVADAAGLFGVWVAPEHRGRGLAASLCLACIEWARAAGFPRICLDVADSNVEAIALYERLGFRPTGNTGTLPEPRQRIREHERCLDLTRFTRT